MSRTPDFELHVQAALKDKSLPARKDVLAWIRAVGNGPGVLTVRFVDLAESRQLNSHWRGKDYATNVLSFPMETQPLLMGDLVVCWPVVQREAIEQGKALEAHAAHMIVHGILHLCGHDHENEAEAEEMEALEREVLAKLGYPDPYL